MSFLVLVFIYSIFVIMIIMMTIIRAYLGLYNNSKLNLEEKFSSE